MHVARYQNIEICLFSLCEFLLVHFGLEEKRWEGSVGELKNELTKTLEGNGAKHRLIKKVKGSARKVGKEFKKQQESVWAGSLA